MTWGTVLDKLHYYKQLQNETCNLGSLKDKSLSTRRQTGVETGRRQTEIYTNTHKYDDTAKWFILVGLDTSTLHITVLMDVFQK